MLTRSFSVFAIVVGALETAGGLQELVYQGILRSRTYPLVAGTLGTLAGALLVAAAVALLIEARPSTSLAWAATLVGVPVFILIGIVTHVAGWPIAAAGMIFPLLSLALSRKLVARERGRAA